MRLFFQLGALAFASVLGLSAADITGIWMGQITGRGGEKQDLAFQFKSTKEATTGTMFGDEFDLPVTELTITGDKITFSVTHPNFYDGSKTKFVFVGTLSEGEMKLTRERADKPPEKDSLTPNLSFVLKKLTS